MKVKEVTIHDEDDIAVVVNEDGQTARVYVLAAGVRITAPIWSEERWLEYINNRVTGQCSGLALEEKEKKPPFFSARTETDCSG